MTATVNYWRDREREARRYTELKKRAGTYQKRIDRSFEILGNKIENRVDSFYLKYANAEGISMAEAKQRVDRYDLESHRDKVSQLIKSKTLTVAAEQELRLYNLTLKVTRLELLQENIRLEIIETFSDVEKLLDDVLMKDGTEEYNRMTQLIGETTFLKNNSEIMRAAVHGSWHNATFSERLWSNQDVLRFELGKLLTTGVIAGENPRVLARRLRDKIESSKANAERLLRTEYAHTQVDAQRLVYEKNNIKQFEFIANGRTACPICMAIDGQIFPVSELETGKNAPPMHPNCMCSTAPYVPNP